MNLNNGGDTDRMISHLCDSGNNKTVYSSYDMLLLKC